MHLSRWFGIWKLQYLIEEHSGLKALILPFALGRHAGKKTSGDRTGWCIQLKAGEI
jgi:hypothetical protein